MMQQLTERTFKSRRSGAVDAVRVVGIVAVVAGHVFHGAAITMGLYTWHVPVFFFLTGYLWTSDRPLKVEVTKRAKTILVPYAVWAMLIAVPFVAVSAISHKLKPQDLLPIILGGSYLKQPFSAFWFITALFVVAIAFRWLQKLPPGAQVAYVVLALFLSTVVGPSLAAVPLSIGIAVVSVVIVAAGALAKKHREIVARPLTFGLVLLLVSAALILSGISQPLDLKAGDFGTPLVSMLVAVAISFGLVLVAEATIPKLGSRTNLGVTTLALGGLMVILAHSFCIWALSFVAAPEWLVFVISLLAPWAMALLVRRTRLSGVLLGVPASNR